MRLTAPVLRLLREARRRLVEFSRQYDFDPGAAWTGLGTPGEYRAGVVAGLFEPAASAPTARVVGWYRLTPLGIRVYAGWLAWDEATRKIVGGGDS